MPHSSIHSSPFRMIAISFSILCTVLILVFALGTFMLHSKWGVKLIEGMLTESIGQDVKIDSLDIEIGQPLGLRLEGMAVSNPPWASNAYLATIKRLELKIDALNLFRGNLVLTNLYASDLLIHLERSFQGQFNWQQKPTPQSAQNPGSHPTNQNEEENDEIELPRVESIVIDEGRLIYDDPTTDTLLHLSFHSSAHDPARKDANLMVKGGGSAFGQPIKLNGSVGPPRPEDKLDRMNVPFEMSFDSIDTHLVMEGIVDALVAPERANLKFSLEGRNLERWNNGLPIELPAFPSFNLSGLVSLEENIWSMRNVMASIANTDVKGDLEISPHSTPPWIEGAMSSTLLELTELQRFMPESETPEPLSARIAGYLSWVALTKWEGHTRYQAERIKVEDFMIKGAEIALQLKDHSLIFEPISGTIPGGRLIATGHLNAEEKSVDGSVQVQFEANSTMGIRSENGSPSEAERWNFPENVNGKFAVDFKVKHLHSSTPISSFSHTQESFDRLEVESLNLSTFQLQYKNPGTKSFFNAQLGQTVVRQTKEIEIEGVYWDQPVTGLITLPPLQSMMALQNDSGSPLPLELMLTVPGTSSSITATLTPNWPLPPRIHARVVIDSQAPEKTAWLLGIQLPSRQPLSLVGLLSIEGNSWNIPNLQIQFGRSDISGSVVMTVAEKIRFDGRLTSKEINVASFISNPPQEVSMSEHNSAPAQLLGEKSATEKTDHVLFPTWFNDLSGNVSFEVNNLILPQGSLQNISIEASVQDGQLRIMPVSFGLGGGTIHTAVGLNLSSSIMTGRFRMTISAVDLDAAMIEFGHDVTELGTINGVIDLILPPYPARNSGSANVSVDSLLEQLSIREISLQYDDPDLEAKTDLRLKADSLSSGAQIFGTVEYRGRPVQVSIATGSLRQAMDNYELLPIDATFQIHKTTIGLEGRIGSMFPLDTYDGIVRVEGPDLVRLGEFLEIPLPHLPPYNLRARLFREQGPDKTELFNFEDLAGTVGDSDVAGTLRVTTGGVRPIMLLDLQSDKLDLDDLAGLVGAPPDPTETASAQQQTQAAESEERETVFPNKPMDFAKLLQMDANVRFRAKQVDAPQLPLDDFQLDVILKDGQMQMDRLNFGVGKGLIKMQLGINAQKEPVKAKFITEFDRVNLKEMLVKLEVGDDSFGTIAGRATLWMEGNSLADWLASADGGLYLIMAGGKVDALLVELAGLDFTESAAVFISTDTGVKIECAYADLQARGGLVTIQPFLLDTNDTKFKGFGEIDLRQEYVDLTVHPYPKDFSFLSSRGPLHVTGTLKNPEFSVDPSFPSPEFGTADDSERCLGMDKAFKKATRAKNQRDGQEKTIESVR